MKTRNGDVAIKIPEIIRVGDPITAKWANGIRESLQRLRDRTPIIYNPPRTIQGPDVPWQPNFRTVDGIEIVTFNLGSVNGIIATNWDDEIPLNPADTKFVVLNISGEANTGAVTALTIDLEDSFPAPDNPVEGTLPASFKVVLGVVKNKTARMLITYNLIAQGAVTFTKSIAAPGEGEEPFVRYWRWQVTQDAIIP